MSCTKNPKEFLFFKWLGPHKPIPTRVRKIFDNDYEVKMQCAVCECTLDALWVDESQMMKHGYDIKKLHKLSRRDFMYTDVEELM